MKQRGAGCVISGVGQSAVGRNLAQSELQLTIDAVTAAVEDAGLTLSQVDGLARAVVDGPMAPGFLGPAIEEVQDALGIATSWQISDGMPYLQAPPAIASGLARHVVLYRTITKSRHTTGGVSTVAAAPGHYAYSYAVGAVSPVNWFAMYANRHMHQYGVTRQQLGWLPVTQRSHAALHPAAVYRDPLTIEEYLDARMISTPLCLFDCDVPVDSSTAIVISAADTTSDLRHPISIESTAFGASARPTWEQVDDVTVGGLFNCADRMWSQTELGPADVDVAQLYDGFSYFAMLWLEAMGFCGKGESGDFVDGGKRIGLEGELPLNTWGGQLSGGRVHSGFGHLLEAVQQLRGEAGARQVANAEVAVVGVGPPSMCSCLLLTRP